MGVRIALPFKPVLPPIALPTRSPTDRERPKRKAAPTHSVSRNQLRWSRVSFQAQYQAFVRFAVASSAALSAIALNPTRVFGTFLLRALIEEAFSSPRISSPRMAAFARSVRGASNPDVMAGT
ncbi:hypothetical protein HNR60_002401 [Rhodopseudomonas rhenobacensis]|uniref:Uncharacterized protein n=1 Tax=Rhodopseudomonas rhenobacensis TaxID=87461 RepID=A0A7W8DYT6_9BRAD|nr:hypothetical protein [Rhodopseudomonas rhenobacensis]MBB5047644.1 hypothetical protein [Rhodopseudomonas rhenobacensis]